MTARKPKPSPVDELRQQAEELLAVQAEILGILVAPTSVSEACEGVVASLRAVVGLDAVGLRFREGDDYPFLGAVGYSDEFLQAENSIAVRYPDGGICRHEDGTAELECTCGVVLRGDTDSTNPLFTAGGSAWINDSASFLDLPPEDDPRLNPRNRCVHVGFQSLALIPVRVGDKILGLLHIADRRKDRFTDESVRFFESLGASIGVALEQRLTMQALRIKNTVFDASSSAIGVVALDGSLVEVNGAFLRVWGYSSKDEVLGKPIGQFLDDEEETSAIMTALTARGEWQGDYVAKRKDGSTFIANGLATVLRNEDGEVSGYQSEVTDVTDRRRTEVTMATRSRIAEFSVAHSLDRTIQNALDEIEAATGSSIGFFHFVDEDQKSLLLQTWSTNTLTTQCTAEGKRSHYSIDKAGVWVDCVREGRPVVHNDYASLPDRKGLPQGHAALVRELTVPVLRGGKTMIVVGVGNKPTDYNQIDLDVVVQLSELILDIVLAKKGQEALLDMSWRMQSVIDGSQFGTWEWNVQTGETVFNERWAEIVGYTLEELAPISIKTWEALTHPDDLKRAAELLERHFAGELSFYDVDIRMKHKDGHWAWLRDRGRVVTRTEDGKPLLMFGTHADIDDSKQIEKVLTHQTQLLTMAERMALMGSWRIDLSTGHVHWSEAMYPLFGVDPGEPDDDMSEVFASAIHPDDRARVEEASATTLLDGKCRPMEYQILLPDGTARWVSAAGSQELDEVGNVIGLAGFVQDITERKQAESALRESHEVIANLTAQVPGVVYQYRLYPDGSSAFPFSSPGMNDIYEYSPDEVREDATPVFGRLHADDYDRVAADIYRSAETLEPFHCEFRVVLPRQGLRWRLCDALPHRTDDGGTLWYGIISDATNRKQADDELAKNAARLSVLVDASEVFAEAGDDHQEMLDQVVRQVSVALDCSCHVRLLSDDGEWLDTAALFNPDTETLVNSRALLDNARLRADDAGITPEVFRTGLPHLAPALTLEKLKAVSPPTLWPVFESIMVYTSTVVPLRVQGRILGTFGLHRHRSDQPPFTDKDMALAQALADRAAMAISNARLLSQLQTELEERVRAEAALTHHHDLMSYVVEHMRGAVAVHDKDLKYVYVSERYLSDYGISERDVIGQHHYDVFPDLPEKWKVVHQRALAGEISSAEDDVYPREDGAADWTCWECRPWYESDGSVGGIIVYTEVITERKRNEEALRRAFEREAATANELLRSAERERRRLAVELHDGLGQMLAAAKLRSQLLASECGGDTSADAFGSLVKLLDQSISAVRSLTVDLSPPALSQGLLPALEWLRDQLSANSRLHCDLIVDRALEGLQGEVRMLVFRASRELLNNVSRHAAADWVRVSGRIDEGVVVLRVEDNGCGFAPAGSSPESSPRHSFGLDSLRQEIRVLSGTLEIDSAPGRGTRVEIRVPLSPPGE